MTIGATIKKLRRERDMTQEQLADYMNITAPAISQWECDRSAPDISQLPILANIFEVSADVLLGIDVSVKQKKIDEYCKKYDDLYRDWAPVDNRISIMRQALAEYPSSEKLLLRLAVALWYKWDEDEYDKVSVVNGFWSRDVVKIKAHKGWEEPVKIMEELLATSVDDKIRTECRDILIRIYASIGEKEKAEIMADYCPVCKPYHLFGAFSGIYDEEAEKYSQLMLISALSRMRIHLPLQKADREWKIKTYETLIGLYKLIFNDGNYGFHNAELVNIYVDYAENLIFAKCIDDAFAALDCAFEYAEKFDVFLNKLRRDGEFKYTSVFLNRVSELSCDVYAKKQLPEFFECVLKNNDDTIYKNLNGDPRYTDLVSRVEKELRKYDS